MIDLAQKINKTEHGIISGGSKASRSSLLPPSGKAQSEGQLDKVVKDSNKIASEEIAGLFSSVVKDRVFGGVKVETSSSAQA